MKKIFVKLAMLMVIPTILLGCGSSSDKGSDKKKSGKIQVMVSISPLKEFAEKVGGDKVDVESLVPDNMEAHDFELKTRDVEKVMNEDLFIYNGAGMEDWLEQLEETASGAEVKFIDSSENSDIIQVNNKQDPHLWLSLIEAQNQCKTIMEALCDIDKDNSSYYKDNYNKYAEELQELYSEYSDKFKNVTTKDFITGHEAFGYLCRDFGLEQKSLTDLFGEGEATAKTYKELADYCKKNSIKTIFSESSESSEEAKTLANEIDGKVEEIYSLESSVKGKNYIEAMRFNLDKIYSSLK